MKKRREKVPRGGRRSAQTAVESLRRDEHLLPDCPVGPGNSFAGQVPVTADKAEGQDTLAVDSSTPTGPPDALAVNSDFTRPGGQLKSIRRDLDIPNTTRDVEVPTTAANLPRILLVVPERIPDPTENGWPTSVTCRFVDIQNAADGQACAYFTSEAVIEHVTKHARYLGARILREKPDGPAWVDHAPPLTPTGGATNLSVRAPDVASSPAALDTVGPPSHADEVDISPATPVQASTFDSLKHRNPYQAHNGTRIPTRRRKGRRTTTSMRALSEKISAAGTAKVDQESRPLPPRPACPYSCLIIDRLPFPRQTDPSLDAIKKHDPGWFVRFALPRAVLAFRQAVGPLLHSTFKRVVVVVLDQRILSRPYGRLFLDCLPGLTLSRRVADIAPYIKGKELGK